MFNSVDDFSYPNTTICATLDSMLAIFVPLLEYGLSDDTTLKGRKRTIDLFKSMIEETRYMASRMETALEDTKDIKKLKKLRSDLKKEYRELKQKVKTLEEKSKDEN